MDIYIIHKPYSTRIKNTNNMDTMLSNQMPRHDASKDLNMKDIRNCLY